MEAINIEQEFFKDGKFVKQSVRAKRFDAFFSELFKRFNVNNRSEALWLLTHERPVCRECGSLTKFKNYYAGYAELCSVECARKNETTKKRRVQSIKGTLDAAHGVTNAMKLPTVKLKVSETVKRRYGTNWYVETDQFKKSSAETSMQNWGMRIPSMSPECKRLTKKSIIERYGRSSPRDFTETRKNRIEKVIRSCVELDIQHDEFDPNKNLKDELYWFRHSCGHEWKQTIDRTLPACSVCHRGSRVEASVKEWVKSLGINYRFNDRTELKPYELDIFLPEQRLAIEVNGLYWHHDDSGRMSVREKTDICEKAGIQLISIWENEWNDSAQREKIQALIKTKLGLSEKIWARNTKLVEVGLREARNFLNAHHLQGWASSSKTLGLTHNDELVMVLSYGVRRWCNGSDVEIIRLCTKKNLVVVGGFSKLLKQLKGLRVISYCDRRFGTGAGYEAVGFKKEIITKPNYVWWKNDTFLKRGSTTKKRLSSLLGDNYDPQLSENENMRAAGWKKLSDAGNIRYSIVIS